MNKSLYELRKYLKSIGINNIQKLRHEKDFHTKINNILKKINYENIQSNNKQ